MGIYTNTAFSGYSSSDYTSVEPFKGDHFNYHELGIIAAAESAANQNAFMKAIALQELASMEQYGTTEVLYESVNIKGIFEKIKAFFKKIIEKIHKIFHTFVAKMASWFGNNTNFAKKYEKEIVKNWSQISNDFEFKGYHFTGIFRTKESGVEFKDETKADSNTIKTSLDEVLAGTKTLEAWLNEKNASTTKEDIAKDRDHLDDIKDTKRAVWINTIKSEWCKDTSGSNSTKLDSKEFTEELFKVFRNGQDSKEDFNKSKILDSYGGSVNGMMGFIKDFDKIKSSLEKSEKSFTDGMEKLISNMNKAENELIKKNSEESKTANSSNSSDAEKEAAKKAINDNEAIVQASSFYQTIVGFDKECGIQAFSALLQATKDACTQAKEIAVKVIGLNKKMTESVDYSDGYTSTAFGGDFISSVKLV